MKKTPGKRKVRAAIQKGNGTFGNSLLLHEKVFTGVYRVAGECDTQFPQRGKIPFGDDVGEVHLASLQKRQFGHGKLSCRVGGFADTQSDQGFIQGK